MFGLTGRSFMSNLTSRYVVRCLLALVIEGHGFTLAERVDRGANTAERKAGGTGDELPRRQRLAQPRGNNSHGHENDARDNHRSREKESDGTEAVAQLRAVAIA